MFEFNATLIVAAISFVVFVLIMNKILYQPINNIVSRRQEYLDENSLAVKNNVEKADSIRLEKENKLSDAKTQANSSIFAEVGRLKQEKAQKENEIKSEVLQKISDTKAELLAEKKQSESILNSQVDEFADAILSKLTGGES